MLQPLDRSVFGPFNAAYNEACSEFLSESPYHAINKGSFPAIFRKAWETGVTKEAIVNGFRACGICPFNPSAVPSEAYAPSAATDKPASVSSAPSSLTAEAQPQPLQTMSPSSQPTMPPSFAQTSVATSTYAQVPTLPTFHSNVDPPITSTCTLPSTPVKRAHFEQMETLNLVSLPAAEGCIEDPQALLKLITSGQLEVITADDIGIASIDTPFTKSVAENDSNNSTTHLLNDSPLVSVVPEQKSVDSVWNMAVDSIFLPPSTPKENVVPRKSKAKTSHRLLTAENVLAEKREIQKKKEDKTRKQVERAERKKIKSMNT